MTEIPWSLLLWTLVLLTVGGIIGAATTYLALAQVLEDERAEREDSEGEGGP